MAGLFVTQKKNTFFAKKGYELAWEQIKLPITNPAPLADLDSADAIQMQLKDGQALISCDRYDAVFNTKKGLLSSLKIDGVELIEGSLHGDFWRAPVDNENRRKMKGLSEMWRLATQKIKVDNVEIKKPTDKIVRIAVKGVMTSPQSTYNVDYSFLASGEIIVSPRLVTKSNTLPRVGMQMILKDSFDQMKWFGLGPNPTYPDRKEERVGVFSGSVEDQWVEYSRPQENGNKVETRWVTLTDSKGYGLMVQGMPYLSVSARYYSAQEMANARHFHELTKGKGIYLNLDLLQRGIGGINSWNEPPLRPYIIKSGRHAYSFVIRPIRKGDDAMSLSKVDYSTLISP